MIYFQEAKCQVPFCYNLKTKIKQQEKQHRLQRSLLTRRRMAIMENTSSSMSQAGPNTPGAPPTPQQEQQPATPIAPYNMPGTPGQSNMAASNTSHGKMGPSVMASPHPGKGGAQQPITQPGSSMALNQYQTGNVQQANTSQQASLQHGQLMNPQQSIRPSPPPQRAIIAAKQAEQVARAQASTGVRSNLQSGYVNPVKQVPMQRPPTAMGSGMQQTQWQNPAVSDYVRQQGNPSIRMTGAAGGNAAMQGNAANMTQPQRNGRWIDMMTKNPQLAAHVIKQQRQQQRPQVKI